MHSTVNIYVFGARNYHQYWLYAFFLVCCCCDTSYIVSVNIQCQATILYTFVVSRAFMAGAASQAGDADSSGHQVSSLVCRGPWMSTVVLYCWCQSDSALVLLYFMILVHDGSEVSCDSYLYTANYNLNNWVWKVSYTKLNLSVKYTVLQKFIVNK